LRPLGSIKAPSPPPESRMRRGFGNSALTGQRDDPFHIESGSNCSSRSGRRPGSGERTLAHPAVLPLHISPVAKADTLRAPQLPALQPKPPGRLRITNLPRLLGQRLGVGSGSDRGHSG
jgi:hypothetical protein